MVLGWQDVSRTPSHRLALPAAILCAALLQVPLAQAYDTIVVFNEIHYHPAGADDPGLEFVEIHNQNSVNVDLSGWRLSGGIDFEFPGRTIIGGGDYLVIASDPAALRAAAGINRVLGPFTGMLDNGGERLRIRNNNDRIMDEVEYNDRPTWPVGADGSGASLSKINPWTTGAQASGWGHSLAIGGTPGSRNFSDPPVPLTINEVAGSEALPGAFFVELHNVGEQDLPLAGFVIATEAGDDYVIPPGVVIPQSAQLSITEATLGFRVEDGDNVYLYLPATTGLVDAVRADDAGRARIPDGVGSLYVTGSGIAETPGNPNPSVPPSVVVINEIMYHHRPTYGEDGNPGIAYAANDEEWIELHNSSDIPVPVGGWELDGAVRFTIPGPRFIPEGGYLVLARDAVAFAAKFPGVPVVGDFSGSLSNQGEELFLLDELGNPADRVFYRDDKPWPPEADGGGSSLELRNPLIDNSVPEAWRASDNDALSEWHDYEFTLTASQPPYSPQIFNFHELRIGLLDSGVIRLDDVSVVEDPGGANRELIANGEFLGLSGWKRIGTHQNSRPTSDAGERVLAILAEGRMNYLNNLIEGNLTFGGRPRAVQHGRDYRVSFRAKWISGSPQFRFELYYNKLARTVILQQPDTHGTPGAQNSTYAADTGPTYDGLRHSPAVPRPGAAIEVSTAASDPSGISDMTLRYRINSGSYLSLPMSFDPADERWKATIPGQANGTLIQFYVQGQDAGPSQLRSFAPAAGARSRAIIKVDSSAAHGLKHSVRINMLATEASAMHASNDILSNLRRGCTMITDEEEIAYDAGIRLRGSMFSRNNRSNTALNLKFPSDRRYRGVHSTITTRKGNRREILVKHIINQAGGLHDNYNDILYQYGHIGEQNGRVRTEMARFGSNYLRGLPGGNGTDGTVFKMEGIRQFQSTQDGTTNTPKTPFPIGWIGNFDIADQGDGKERYRHNMRINGNFEVDDYDAIIRMCKTFSLNGQALEDAVPAAIDVDKWTRQFALLSLCGIGDTYSQGNPHNINFYVRPGDGLVESIPWDWDFTFNRSTSAPLWGNKNVSKIFARPVYRRLYHGHLRDIIRTTYNARYLNYWFRHFGTCSGESYTGNINYVTARGAYVLAQLSPQVSFRITTNGGAAFSTAEPSTTLVGDGWINVREVFLNGAPEPVALRWTDGDSWSFSAPLLPGANTLVLLATDHRGTVVGTSTIVVTNTGVVEPASAENIAISEVMYHPAGIAAEEYLEFSNISSSGAAVDLSGATFTAGIEFVFPANSVVAAGERLLVVQDAADFLARYGPGLPVAGVFANGTRLSNGGERLRLEGLGGEIIRDFAYDNKAPWPEAPDDAGHSMVLIAPASNPDHADALNWRSSVAVGGIPNASDASEFTGDPNGDDNGDGLSNFMNYAFGAGGVGPHLRIAPDGHLELSYPRKVAADDVVWFIELSDDLESWLPDAGVLELDAESAPQGGVSTVVYRSLLPLAPAATKQFLRIRIEKR